MLQEDDWVIIVLPDESERLLQIKASKMVDLGRFGRFPASLLVGVKAGGYYKIGKDGSLEGMEPDEVSLEEGPTSVEKVVATNETLTDTNTSQRLTTSDIEALKQQVISGDLPAKALVDSVIANSDTFTQKNAYSQIKYVKRKQSKFLRWFRLSTPSVRTLSNYFMKRDPRKIMDLRLDSLSQLLCLANVQAEAARILIWDESLGFVTGAILSKVSPKTELVNVHLDRQMQVPMLIYYNLSESQRVRLYSLPLAALNKDWDEDENGNRNGNEGEGVPTTTTTFRETPGADAHRTAIQRARFEQRQAKQRIIKNWIDSAAFDSLVIVTSKTDPLLLIERLTFLLRPSSRIIIYSTWRELLLPSYSKLRQESEWVDVSLSESWLRPYQAAPGRFHPSMNCNGHSGTILSATKIVSTEPTKKTPLAVA